MNDKRLTPLQAIKQYCFECAEGDYKEIKGCRETACPLHTYRMGHNPNRKGIGRVKAQKSILGKYKPSQDGMKKVNIKAYSQAGKLRIILPSGDTLVVLDKKTGHN